MTDLDVIAKIEFQEGSSNNIKGDEDHSSGFSGFLAGINLPDIVQLACLENKSRKLSVFTKKDSGEIYFKDGEVIHASTKDKKGEKAFYEILSWEKGTFKFSFSEPVTRSIEIPWNFLLIEALRLKDENKVKSSQKASQKTKALIVDDSKFFVSRLREYLEISLGVEIVGEASNGKEALEIIKNKRPDIITLDINMPVMTGDVALKHIMIRSPSPVVLISNFSPETTPKVMEFLRLGAVDFIAKPVGNHTWDSFSEQLKKVVKETFEFNVQNIRRARNPRRPEEKLSPGVPAERLLVFLGGKGGLLELQKIFPLLRPSEKTGILIFQTMCPVLSRPFCEYMNGFCSFSINTIPSVAPLLSNQAWLTTTLSKWMMRSDESGAGIFSVDEHENKDLALRLFHDLSHLFRKDLAIVILSGVSDSLIEGFNVIEEHGGTLIIQKSDTALKGGVLEQLKSLSLYDHELSPEDMPEFLNAWMSGDIE